MTNKRFMRMLVAGAALLLLAAACGSSDGDGGTASGDQLDLTGTINVSGSSTVAPITTRVAEMFADKAPDVTVNVDGPGTGDGFKLFCSGETDLSDASRPIKREEADDCRAKGIEYIELKVGIDGLTVMTNPANSSVECLNFMDLYALAGPESKGFKKWNDASSLAKELGSTTTFPDASLDMAGPGEESGTYDSFIELALEKTATTRQTAGKIAKDQVKTTRPDYQSSGDDNIIIQAIEGSKSSFGWVGYSYAAEQGDKVKLVKVAKAPNGECVAPTSDTIASAKYPLSRYLYIYVNSAKRAENEAIDAFVDFYLNDGVSAVSEVKYVPLASADLAKTREVWTAKTVGTRDGGK